MCVPHCFTVCLVGACINPLPDRWPEQPASPPTPSPSPPPPPPLPSPRPRRPRRGLCCRSAIAVPTPPWSPPLPPRAAAEKAKEALAPALRTIGQDGFTDLGNILASAVVRGFMHAGRGRVGRASPAERRGLRGRALPPAAASVGAPAPPRRPRRPCSTSCPSRRPWPHMFCIVAQRRVSVAGFPPRTIHNKAA